MNKFKSIIKDSKKELDLLNKVKESMKIIEADLKEIHNRNIKGNKLRHDIHKIKELESYIEIIESDIEKINLIKIHCKTHKVITQKHMNGCQSLINKSSEYQDILTDRLLNCHITPNNYSEQYKCMYHLAKSGWTYPYFCNKWFHMSNKDLRKISRMSQNQLDRYFSRIICNQHQHYENGIMWAHYSILDEALDEIALSLDKGHAKQIKSIKKNLVSNNYKNYFNDIFPILEYLYYVYIKGSLSGKRTFSSKTANTEITKCKKLLKKHHTALLLCILNEYRVIKYLYRSIKGYNYNNMPYGRNSSTHGKLNPEKLKFVDFIKLILLCRNYSCDICIYSFLKKVNKLK